MLNKIVTDNNLDVQLLINLQSPRTFDETLIWENTIYVEIDADDTASQNLEVDGGTYGSTSYPITPGQVNTVEIDSIYWNYDGTTTVTLVKGGSNVASFDIIFPEAVDSLGMLNQDESLFTQFTMSGSKSDTTDLVNEVTSINQTVETMEQDLNGKQNFIDLDVLPPSGSGSGGHLTLNGVQGDNFKRLYRYENNNWVRTLPYCISNNGPTDVQEGDLWFETDGTNISRIGIYKGGNWYFFNRGGSGLQLPRIRSTGLIATAYNGKIITNLSTNSILFLPQEEKRAGATYITDMAVVNPLGKRNNPFKISIRFYLPNQLNKWTGLIGGINWLGSTGNSQVRYLPWLQISDNNYLFGCLHLADNDNDRVSLLSTVKLQSSTWYRGELEWNNGILYLRLYDGEDTLLEELNAQAASYIYDKYNYIFGFGGSNYVVGYALNYGNIDISNTYWTVNGKIRWGLDARNHEGGAERIISDVATPIMATLNKPYGTCFASSSWTWGSNDFQPYNCFRQNNSDGNWGASNAIGQYIGFKFDSSIVITRVETFCPTGNRPSNPSEAYNNLCKEFKFQASDDGSNWVDLATCVCQDFDVDNWQTTGHNIFNIQNNTDYFYYRLLITRLQGNAITANTIAFSCINMYE